MDAAGVAHRLHARPPGQIDTHGWRWTFLILLPISRSVQRLLPIVSRCDLAPLGGAVESGQVECVGVRPAGTPDRARAASAQPFSVADYRLSR
jgi:hypothetical protein